MNQVFDKTLIFERIKDSGFPFWGLYLSNGFNNRVNIMQYWGSDFADEDNDETKLEKSIERLKTTIEPFPSDSVFIIELRASKNANGNGIIGPLHFVKESAKKESATSEGLATVPAGYVPADVLTGVKESLSKEFEDRLEAYKAQVAQEKKEEEYLRKCEELDKREAELKDLEKGYNSSVAKTADIALKVVEGLGAMLLPGLFGKTPAAAAIPSSQQLGTPAPASTPAPPDPKEEKVNEICDLLYEKYTPEQLSKMLNNLKTGKDGILETETTDTATAATFVS